MNKFTISVNTHLIDKTKLVDRDYTNKDGKEVLVKELKLEVIPLKEVRFIKGGDGWKMLKVGFVTQSPSKEDKANKVKMPVIGDAIRFESDKDNPNYDTGRGVVINPDDIPF